MVYLGANTSNYKSLGYLHSILECLGLNYSSTYATETVGDSSSPWVPATHKGNCIEFQSLDFCQVQTYCCKHLE